MSNSTVTVELTEEEARRPLDGLETTAMIAGDCALPDEKCEEGCSEFGAIDEVDRFIGRLRRQLEG